MLLEHQWDNSLSAVPASPLPPPQHIHTHTLGLTAISSLSLTPLPCPARCLLFSHCQELTASRAGILCSLCAQVRMWWPRGWAALVPSLDPREQAQFHQGRGLMTADGRGLGLPKTGGDLLLRVGKDYIF